MSHENDPSIFSPGTLIASRYEVTKVLGSGGMGVVVSVKDRALESEVVALKMLYPEMSRDKIQFARFRNEVLISRKLAHPNIVRLYDFGAAAKGYYFISMEYVGGGSLGQRIYSSKRPCLTFQEIVRILFEISQGLSGAHQQGVVHRDLKPDNVLLTEEGVVKLTDFGLARSLDVEKGFTNTGETVGTPFYMAPEQLRGDRPDQRVDIYSLGILAFEMAVGKRPFYDEDYMKLARMHFVEPIPTFATKGSGIPKWFEKFVQKCCAKHPDDRYGSAEDVSEVLFRNLAPEQAQGSKHRLRGYTSGMRSRQKQVRDAIVRQSAAALVILTLFASVLWLIRENSTLKQEIAGIVLRTARATGIDLSAVEGAIEGQLGASDFFTSIVSGNKRAVEQLLSTGIEASSTDNQGTPALHLAVRAGRAEIVSLLLDRGADANQVDEQGRTALFYAARSGFVDCVGPLLKYGASVAIKDSASLTPLLIAVKNDQRDVLDALLAAGAPLSATDELGRTALHWAVLGNNEAVVRRLINAKATLEKDTSGKTPLDYARREHYDAILKILSE